MQVGQRLFDAGELGVIAMLEQRIEQALAGRLLARQRRLAIGGKRDRRDHATDERAGVGAAFVVLLIE